MDAAEELQKLNVEDAFAALEAEKIHAELYQQALDAVSSGKDLDTDFFLCPVCGHTEFGSPPDKCPVCGVPGSKFSEELLGTR